MQIATAPSEVVEEFKKDRKAEVREATYVNQKYHLKNFVTWTDEIELDDTRDLNGYVLNRYKTWRRDNYSINDVTLYNNLMTIRALMRWCEDRELVEENLADKMDIPKPENPVRDATIPPERALKIIRYYGNGEPKRLRR